MSSSLGIDADPSVLFHPGERLGWQFRPRTLFERRFTEPAPVIAPPSIHLHARLQQSSATLPVRMTLAILAAGFGVLLLAAAVGNEVFELLSLAVVLTVAGCVVAGVAGFRHLSLKQQVLAAERHRQEQWRWERRAWEARRSRFDEDERRRLDQIIEWGAVPPPPGHGRVEIVGGTFAGWQALLTVYGASLIASRGPMVLVDLTGQVVCDELVRTTANHGVTVDALALPDQLAESDLLVGLTPRELVDALVEAIHPGDAAASRADRAMDDRILTAVCGALAPAVSFDRLAAALRALMGEPTGRDDTVLTPDERRLLTDELFSEQYRRNAHPHLSRLESFIYPLRGLGSVRESRPAAALTCLAMLGSGRNVRDDLLHELIVQWLTRRVANGSTWSGSLVVAGADDLPARHLERLGDLCLRQESRLVLLFRHLAGSATEFAGGGAVSFMRLGNHDEARRAAEFIGREHTFALSQLTRTIGENRTYTDGDTEGSAASEGESVGTSEVNRLFSPQTLTKGKNWSASRNWSRTRSIAQGTNWSEAAGWQRVYEFAVEPRTLQELPEYALLAVERGPERESVTPVECNPELIAMPRFSMDPLPPSPLPPENSSLPSAAVEPHRYGPSQVWR